MQKATNVTGLDIRCFLHSLLFREYLFFYFVFLCRQTETIASLSGLPDEFVAQKRSYRCLAEWMTGWIEHMHEHLAQMKVLLKVARTAAWWVKA